MALQRMAYVSLDECVTAYIDESEQSNHKYFKLWNIAFRALTELGLDFFYTIKSVKLPISSTFTVKLPDDYLKYTKVGVLNENGEIIPMGYNNKLTAYADLQPNRIEATQDNTIPNLYQFNTPIWYNYWNGGSLNNLYGLPGGQPFVGSFKVDNEHGLILLNETFGYDYLMVEYVSAPKEGEQYYLPIHFKEAVIAYLRWKDIISINVKTHMANSNINMRRRDYYNERRLAIARYDPIDLHEAYQWNLENQRMTVKN